MYKYYNPNPTGRTTAGDCAIRAVALFCKHFANIMVKMALANTLQTSTFVYF